VTDLVGIVKVVIVQLHRITVQPIFKLWLVFKQLSLEKGLLVLVIDQLVLELVLNLLVQRLLLQFFFQHL
jgi:hypothetical protein